MEELGQEKLLENKKNGKAVTFVCMYICVFYKSQNVLVNVNDIFAT